MLAFLLMLITIVPSMVYVLLNQSSLASGLALSCLLIIPLGILPGEDLRLQLRTLTLWSVTFLTLLVSVVVREIEGSKALLSVPLLAGLVISAFVIAHVIQRLNTAEVIGAMKALTILFLGIGMAAAAFEMAPAGYANFGRPVFPYSEPSHFALAAGPILLVGGAYLSQGWRIVIIGLAIALSLIFPSFVLLSYPLLMLAIYYRTTKALVLASCLALIVVVIVLDNQYLYSYFAGRLDFSEESTNITALVYAQGWNHAFQALVESNGVGLGFQKLDSLSPGDIAERILEHAGRYKNLEDGSFLLSKLVGELGLAGIVLATWYVSICIKAIKYLKSLQAAEIRPIDSRFPLASIGCLLVLGFIPEMFLRGTGYFSPGVMLLFVGVFLAAPTILGRSTQLPQLRGLAQSSRVLQQH